MYRIFVDLMNRAPAARVQLALLSEVSFVDKTCSTAMSFLRSRPMATVPLPPSRTCSGGSLKTSQ